MSSNLPTYRKWLAYIVLGLVIIGLLAPVSEGVDDVITAALIAFLLALLGVGLWEDRHRQQADRGSNAANSSSDQT